MECHSCTCRLHLSPLCPFWFSDAFDSSPINSGHATISWRQHSLQLSRLNHDIQVLGSLTFNFFIYSNSIGLFLDIVQNDNDSKLHQKNWKHWTLKTQSNILRVHGILAFKCWSLSKAKILTFRHWDMHNMKSTITVVEENGKGCIDYHDTKGDDRQDPSLWRTNKCIWVILIFLFSMMQII